MKRSSILKETFPVWECHNFLKKSMSLIVSSRIPEKNGLLLIVTAKLLQKHGLLG